MSHEELSVHQEFMSEDYFGSEGTKESFKAKALELRKQWETEADEARTAGHDPVPSPLSQWGQARGRLQSQLISLTDTALTDTDLADAEAPLAFYRDLLTVLGYSSPEYRTVEGPSSLEIRGHATEADATPLLVVFARPADSVEGIVEKGTTTNPAHTLLRPAPLHTAPTDDTTEDPELHTSVARFLSAHFVEESGPDLALVLAGRFMLLTEKSRWAEGRYLSVDLSLLLERDDTKKGGAVDQFFACASARAVAPSTDGSTWFLSVLEDSVNHAQKVSEDLREAVRESIEIIANEVVRRRKDQGLDPLAPEQAQVLARQSLRFLYRILFLLYAEASPELRILPTGTTEYEAGYSLDRLRDLATVPLHAGGAGTHLFQSLHVLFRLIDTGHNEYRGARSEESAAEAPPSDGESLTFRRLEADLFSSEATDLIDAVELGNTAMQEVLTRLLLSKEKKGKDRGFISYAELGINQLGRVYEGLMSYTGFFADQPLYEVAKGGDNSKGSWVVPVAKVVRDQETGESSIAAEDFVRTTNAMGEQVPVRYEAGRFVFRLSGRERQQSASYYTPEVLTKFTVSQALEELLTEDMPADRILDLTLCEPALGSGAFALEGVRQLATAYLQRKQDELGEKIDPAAYPLELQKTKAYIALHNTYGVDLNDTAVELAEISLWLDTMVPGLAAPWFGLRLKRGNSLVGARRTTYSVDALTKHEFLKNTPLDQPLSALGQLVSDGGRGGDQIFQFLLPSNGWGAAADAKEGKNLAPEAVKKLKNWRKTVRKKLSKTKANNQIETLRQISAQVDELWAIALRRLHVAQAESRRSLDIWGHPHASEGTTITRKEIEEKLQDENGVYRRLRRVMDAWCALWFWPLTEDAVEPPSIDEWLDGLKALVGMQGQDNSRKYGSASKSGQASLVDSASWHELSDIENNALLFGGAREDVDGVLDAHPWLQVCERIAGQQGFFHWELDFAPVFAQGGFDLQLGNPPWVRPMFDYDALLAEGDPWWQLANKPSEAVKKDRRERTLAIPGIQQLVLDAAVDVIGQAEFISDVTTYPLMVGFQPDLYRCFMEQTWRHNSVSGIVGLIHPESHFTDESARSLREMSYRRLNRHWQFINELSLFEIHHLVTYGVHIYGMDRIDPDFVQASSLYHPSSAEGSLAHNGDGQLPGLKDSEQRWDLRPHRDRLIRVDTNTLRTWHDTLESDAVPVRQTKMLYTVNTAAAEVISKLASADRIGQLNPQFSSGWHEKSDRVKGRFDLKWGEPDAWSDVILQGPNFHVGVPFYKQPNPTMKNNLDWSTVDLEYLPAEAVPTTSYKPIHDGHYDREYTHWDVNGQKTPARDHYRIAWRAMAANTGERTLIPAIIPPGTAHINGVFSFSFKSYDELLAATAVMMSLLADFNVRAAPKSGIYPSAVERQPKLPDDHRLLLDVMLRVLRLNAMTDAYADLWEKSWDTDYRDASWTPEHHFGQSEELGDVTAQWSSMTPLRLAADRRQAQVEIDALVALMLGVTADELCSIYRTQFPVLYGYDTKRDHYDANGRLVPAEVLKTWKKKGAAATPEDLSSTNAQGYTYTYAPPFVTLDREADMRQAYSSFSRELTEG
ncbi:class I SAM-dependent DNA methyltransferase [Brevibacterium litoralis]|uniref:class I SAM-dependent DNA methyltransferase n=1 Tax=Brevibacterium litoralis TaxID=3138935 RepID=UPI0032EDB91A